MISYKAYFYSNKPEPEVRRFDVDAGMARDFQFLKAKLGVLFPSVKINKETIISWRDADGDEIVICSDEELVIALNEMAAVPVKKIYVSAKPLPMNHSKNPGPALHEGVSCDGCNGPVEGYRYKCINCPNYDLCSNCESIGVHPEHFMVRISAPIELRGHGFGRKLARNLAKCGRRHGQYHGAGGVRGGGQCGASTREGAPPAPGWGDEGWMDSVFGLLHQVTSDPQTSSLANNLRQGLSYLLDPLGNIHNAEMGKNAATGSPGDTSGASAGPSRTNQAEQVNLNRTESDGNPTSQSKVNPSAPPNVNQEGNGSRMEENKTPTTSMETEDTPTPAPAPAQAPQATPAPQTTPAPQPPVGMPIGFVAAFGGESGEAGIYPTLEKDKEATKESGVSQRAEDWVLVPPVLVPAPAAAEPEPWDRPDPLASSNPKVEESLRTMLTMGFTNDGNWLRSMLESRGGSIEAVLDLLTPTARPR